MSPLAALRCREDAAQEHFDSVELAAGLARHGADRFVVFAAILRDRANDMDQMARFAQRFFHVESRTRQGLAIGIPYRRAPRTSKPSRTAVGSHGVSCANVTSK